MGLIKRLSVNIRQAIWVADARQALTHSLFGFSAVLSLLVFVDVEVFGLFL